MAFRAITGCKLGPLVLTAAKRPLLSCLDLPHLAIENKDMQIPGHIANGVVVFDGGPIPPEGTPVVILCAASADPPTTKYRVQLPLVDSAHPASVTLTGAKVAELLEEDDVSS